MYEESMPTCPRRQLRQDQSINQAHPNLDEMQATSPIAPHDMIKAHTPKKKTKKMKKKQISQKVFGCVGVVYTFFLACNVNVVASGVFFYARQINLGGLKKKSRGLGRPKYLFDIWFWGGNTG